MIVFTIEGDPMAWERVRMNRKTGAFYNTDRMTSRKRLVALRFKAELPAGWDPSGGFAVLVRCYFARPKKFKKALVAGKDLPYLNRPDFDNLVKLIGDALNGVAWLDDKQIYDGRVQKFYCDEGMLPHTRILISRTMEETVSAA